MDPTDLAGRLVRLEEAVGAIGDRVTRLTVMAQRVEDVLAKIEPVVDDLRPMVAQLMAGKLGRMIRLLSGPGD
jgi:hypothetical protein